MKAQKSPRGGLKESVRKTLSKTGLYNAVLSTGKAGGKLIRETVVLRMAFFYQFAFL